MRVDVISIQELSESMKERWLDLQSSNPFFFGPSFHPELFVSVGKFHPHIFVALLSTDQGICGFFPFLKKATDSAEKIPHCDYEAIISGPEQHWDIGGILKKIGVESWTFKALAGSDNIKPKRGDFREIDSPRVDLSEGFDKYAASLQHGQVGGEDLMRKKKALERAMGPIHFVADSNDTRLIRQLMDWKVLRYRQETGWGKLHVDLFEYIQHLKHPRFQGVLSAIYAGDRVLAINYGIRYHRILKGMVMSFDPEFEKYSLGHLLLYFMITQYEALDYNVLDFGPGEHPKKEDFTNSALPVIQGTFNADSFKERVKSIRWLYRSVLPLARSRRNSNMAASRN